jgi:hypothetical protein
MNAEPQAQAWTPAERMRRARKRRKDGTGLTPMLEIFKPEIELLIKWGFLSETNKKPDGTFAREELEQAIYRFFDDAFPAVERIKAQIA